MQRVLDGQIQAYREECWPRMVEEAAGANYLWVGGSPWSQDRQALLVGTMSQRRQLPRENRQTVKE
jgi:hypothetical protein